jgi:hypothetical protein
LKNVAEDRSFITIDSLRVTTSYSTAPQCSVSARSPSHDAQNMANDTKARYPSPVSPSPLIPYYPPPRRDAPGRVAAYCKTLLQRRSFAASFAQQPCKACAALRQDARSRYFCLGVSQSNAGKELHNSVDALLLLMGYLQV